MRTVNSRGGDSGLLGEEHWRSAAGGETERDENEHSGSDMGGRWSGSVGKLRSAVRSPFNI